MRSGTKENIYFSNDRCQIVFWPIPAFLQRRRTVAKVGEMK